MTATTLGQQRAYEGRHRVAPALVAAPVRDADPVLPFASADTSYCPRQVHPVVLGGMVVVTAAVAMVIAAAILLSLLAVLALEAASH